MSFITIDEKRDAPACNELKVVGAGGCGCRIMLWSAILTSVTLQGPIQGGEIVLKSHAQVVGDIHHQSLAIESGAFFDGRSMQVRGNGQAAEKLEKKSVRQVEHQKASPTGLSGP